jgi:hypothetical protein
MRYIHQLLGSQQISNAIDRFIIVFTQLHSGLHGGAHTSPWQWQRRMAGSGHRIINIASTLAQRMALHAGATQT